MSATLSPKRKTPAPPQRPPAPLPPADPPPGPIRRFTVAEYDRLIELGMLAENDPYHLLNGVIRFKMPTNTPHISTAMKLEGLFWRMLPLEYILSIQKPVSFPNSDSQPEPDLAVVLGPAARYEREKAGASDVFLVVEVADTSLAADRGEMLDIYAGGKMPEYWIVNIVERMVEVYTQPRGGKKPTYKSRTDYAAGESVPVVLGGKPVGAIAVSDILPGGN